MIQLLRFGFLLLFFCTVCGIEAAVPAGAMPEVSLFVKAQIRRQIFRGTSYYLLSDIAKAYGMTFKRESLRARLSGRGMNLTVTYNKRYGSYNGTQISLLFAPAVTGSSVWVSELDYRNVIQPLLSSLSLRRQNIRTICIDAGHGGNDQGCRGRSYKEKDVTLRVALKLRNRLQSLGYRVIMTRSADATLTLPQRPAIARRAGADLFISVHCNAVGNRAVDGIETFCLTPAGAPSTHDSKPRSGSHAGNVNNKNNFRLAHEIHRAMITGTGNSDRGVKHARFAVLRDAHCPAVLVELGFLSNARDEKDLGSVVYQDKLVKLISDAVVRYHRTVKK